MATSTSIARDHAWWNRWKSSPRYFIRRRSVSAMRARAGPGLFSRRPQTRADLRSAAKQRRIIMRSLSLFSIGFFLYPAVAQEPSIKLHETDDYVQIDTDALQAKIRKKGYVSGIA